MKKLIAAALGAVAIFGAAGVANATADPAVCDGINSSSSYTDYLITAAVIGAAGGWDQDAQAQNIVDSVVAYCPWHAKGLLEAAKALSRQGSYTT
jgi:hypothetical protein